MKTVGDRIPSTQEMASEKAEVVNTDGFRRDRGCDIFPL